MGGESETLREILAAISDLKSDINGLRQAMQNGFEGSKGELQELREDLHGVREDLHGVREDLREVRTIQDAQGREIYLLREGVESIGRKLARLGEILR